MRIILPTAVAGFAVVVALSSALAAPGATNGPVASSPIAQTPLGNPDVPAPQPAKPTVGTSDTATGAAAPTPPGTDNSTSAPGGQPESTKNGALGTTMGDNVVHRHHGPKRPTVTHHRSDASGPPADATSK
jgi:hypothetical protein